MARNALIAMKPLRCYPPTLAQGHHRVTAPPGYLQRPRERERGGFGLQHSCCYRR